MRLSVVAWPRTSARAGVVLVLVAGLAQAAEVSVAVAANFTAPMQRIAALFAQQTGHKAVLSFGSTGKLYAQIRNGAPFQVLLAADDKTPARLEAEALSVSGMRFTYAVGRLALWSSQDSLVDTQGAVLRSGGFARLALADPKLAPYGAAAVETLTRMALLSELTPKFVYGENIAQAYQFVATGNAELGFVALSQIFSDGRVGRGSAWVVPTHMHTPIRQDAVLLKTGENQPAARELMAFLRGDAARAVIRSYGYDQ